VLKFVVSIILFIYFCIGCYNHFTILNSSLT
jgi:hypothetical protein